MVLRCPPTGAKTRNANGYVDTVWWVNVTVGALAAALGQITHQPANCRRMLALPVSVSRELFLVHFLLRERDHQGFTQDLSSCSDNYIIFRSDKVTMVHYNNTRSCIVYSA